MGMKAEPRGVGRSILSADTADFADFGILKADRTGRGGRWGPFRAPCRRLEWRKVI